MLRAEGGILATLCGAMSTVWHQQGPVAGSGCAIRHWLAWPQSGQSVVGRADGCIPSPLVGVALLKWTFSIVAL